MGMRIYQNGNGNQNSVYITQLNIDYNQEYIIKERREYRTRLCSALNVCGESRAWNANHVRLLAWECAGTFVYYNVFGNGRQIISIPSA